MKLVKVLILIIRDFGLLVGPFTLRKTFWLIKKDDDGAITLSEFIEGAKERHSIIYVALDLAMIASDLLKLIAKWPFSNTTVMPK